MASEKTVTVQVLGGAAVVFSVDEVPTVGAAKAKLNLGSYVATVNGEPANDSDELYDFSFCTLSPSIKGGC